MAPLRSPLSAALLALPLLPWAACAGPAPAGRAPVEAAEAARLAVARMEGWFPNVELVTHRGERVRFYDDLVRGRCVLVQFMYTTCEDT